MGWLIAELISAGLGESWMSGPVRKDFTMTTPRPGPDTIKEELLNQTLLTESHWAGEDLSCYTEQAASTQETVAVIHTILFQSCHGVTRRHCGRLSKSNFLKPKKAQCVCERTITVFLLVYSDGTYHCFVQFWPLQDNIIRTLFFHMCFKIKRTPALSLKESPNTPHREVIHATGIQYPQVVAIHEGGNVDRSVNQQHHFQT